MSNQKPPRAQFSSKLAFILAAIGAAVGLGNIWKFPYITGQHGGGAFIIVYLACIVLIGVPVFIAELYIGRESQSNVVDAFKEGKAWKLVGVLGILTTMLVLGVYCIIGGWILDFEFQSLMGQFSEKAGKGEVTGPLERPLWRQLLGTALFYLFTVGIVMGGVQKGIEAANKFLIPSLVVLLVGLFAISCFLPGAGAAVDFLFYPDFSRLSSAGIVEAVGHAFFTLSVGFGAIITYGSYLAGKGQNLSRISFTVAGFDTLIALLVGFVIFAVGFSFEGFQPNSGPTLIFETIPSLFAKLSWGYIGSILFFLLVAFAAITSAISMIEIIVLALSETLKIPRRMALLATGAVLFGLSILITLYFDPLFNLLDGFTTHWLMPLGGLGISVYMGWILGPRAIGKVTGGNKGLWYHGLLWTLRVLTPLGIAALVIQNIAA